MYKIWLQMNPEEDTQEELNELLPKVSEQRRKKALQYKFLSGQLQSLRAYRLLCRGLEEYGITDPPEFSFGKNGKPEIPDYPEVCFNFSHCKKAVLCALSDRPIGADVETAQERINEKLLSFCMNEKERADILTAADPGMRFAFWWTRKEALLKLTGDGIRNDMRDVLAEAEDNYIFESHECPDRGIAYTVCIKR